MGTGLYTEVIHNEVAKYQRYLIRCEHMVGDREMISVEEKSLNDMYISSHVPPTPQQGGNQSVANFPFLHHKRVGPSHLTTSEIKKAEASRQTKWDLDNEPSQDQLYNRSIEIILIIDNLPSLQEESYLI